MLVTLLKVCTNHSIIEYVLVDLTNNESTDDGWNF